MTTDTERLAEARTLLKVAACPADCIDEQLPPDGHQCQFCAERRAWLAHDDTPAPVDTGKGHRAPRRDDGRH